MSDKLRIERSGVAYLVDACVVTLVRSRVPIKAHPIVPVPVKSFREIDERHQL
jgi:hypothetical protein